MPIAPPAPDAEEIALRALAFLVADEDRLARFLGLTGLDLADLGRLAADPRHRPALLGAVLDQLLGWEAWLLAFAGEIGLDPARIADLRRSFPGG